METDATGKPSIRMPPHLFQPSAPERARLTWTTLWRRGAAPTSPTWVHVATTALLVLGAASIAISAAIHFHLWLAGYRHIRWIGPLFFLQFLTGVVLAIAIAVFRRLLLVGAGVLFMIGSIGALTLSATVGFLGLHDGLEVPWALPSLIIEIIGFVFLATACLVPGDRT